MDMLIFIDESGIHKQVDHSTFVLAYIESRQYAVLEKQIIDIERKTRITEFHWSKTVWKIKVAFMDEVLGLDFTAKVAVVKNPVRPAEELERVLAHLMVEHRIRNVYIDGQKPKWYARRIKHILRAKGISVQKLKTVKASQYAGIRLADMVAGLVRSYYDKKNFERIEPYYRRLEKKIVVTLT